MRFKISKLYVDCTECSGVDTFELNSNLKSLIDIADIVVMYIFIVELLIRSHGTKFFSDGWNNFDFVIIVISLAPSSGAFNVFRVFRVFRALRLVSSMPEMQRMVEAMMRSLRGIAAISWLLCIVVYVYSVMGTILFGSGGVAGETYFGNLGLSAYSLFQIMTLESWSNGIARMIIEELVGCSIFHNLHNKHFIYLPKHVHSSFY